MPHARVIAALAATTAFFLPSPVAAQSAKQIVATRGQAGINAVCVRQGDGSCTPVDVGTPLPTIGKQETFQLVLANTPAAAVTVAGGDYILTQTCTGYGTVTFQVLGPDAATYLPLGSYTASDTGSGHGFALGSYAKVRVSVSGTTGCAVLLSRVPA